MAPCQSIRFYVENVRVKDLGKLKSHKPPNPIKRMDKNLSINRHTLLDIIIIIEDLGKNSSRKVSNRATLVRVKMVLVWEN